jgi:ABC-type branched-subunit amino acid transport system ATPase component
VYHSITIRNLRAISHLTVEGLRRVNLVVGRNGAGKTTLLEAVALLDHATDPAGVATLATTRISGQDLQVGVQSFFPAMDPGSTVEVTGQWARETAARRVTVQAAEPQAVEVGRAQPLPLDDGARALHAFRLIYTPAEGPSVETTGAMAGSIVSGSMRPRQDLHPVGFLTPAAAADGVTAQFYGQMVAAKQKGDLVAALQVIAPALQDIAVIPRPGGTELMVDVGLARMLPAGAIGGGFGRLFALLTGLRACKDGVLLVDEIESGLHHSVYESLWKLVGDATSRFDVQVFATTHSEELLRSALQHFASGDDLAVIRMDRLPDGQHRAVRYDREMQEAVLEAGFEVRG